MHCRTFAKLLAKHDHFVDQSLAGIMMSFKMALPDLE